MTCLQRSGAVLAAAAFILAAAPATAQSYIQPPCPAGPIPRFEDHLQALWYRRFWTGDCHNLPAFGCRSGSPYWNEVVKTAVARAPTSERIKVTQRVCGLGRRIGFEWTRPKSERRIDTKDLQSLNSTLEKAPDILVGLTLVEGQVRGKLKS